MAILLVGPSSLLYPTIADAMFDAGPGDTIELESGYSNETATITQTGMTVSGSAASVGIVLQLATGIPTFTLTGAAPIRILDATDGNGIVGNAGSNTIIVSGGADAVDGGAGNDRLVVDYHLATGAVTGNSTSNFSEAGGGARSVTITSGTIEHFTVLTGPGADTITTGDGNDLINVGAGANTVTAGNGANTVIGGDDADTITTGDGSDIVNAGAGTNTVTAGQGANTVIGGNDADTITALDGGNLIDGGDGTNSLTSGGGDDTVLSGTGADTIITGGGSDRITVRGGADSVDSGAGNDRLIVDYAAMTTAVTGGITGGNLVTGHVGSIADLVTSTVNFQRTEHFTITTGSGNDRITTGGGNDVLSGLAGDDTLIGGSGNDRLNGGLGIDRLYGGTGDDTYVVDTQADLVFENLGAGLDTVITTAGFQLYDNLENLILATGAGAIDGVGNALANGLTGNEAANKLLGGLGADTINGKGGNDFLFGQDGADTFVFERGTGRDVIADFTPGTDKVLLTGLGFSSFAQVDAATRQNGASSVIDFGLTEFVILQNVAKASLSAGDFLFS